MLLNIYYILGCAEGWTSYNNGCYRYFEMPKSWEDARKHCLEFGADLVSLHSEEDADFLLKLTKREPVR